VPQRIGQTRLNDPESVSVAALAFLDRYADLFPSASRVPYWSGNQYLSLSHEIEWKGYRPLQSLALLLKKKVLGRVNEQRGDLCLLNRDGLLLVSPFASPSGTAVSASPSLTLRQPKQLILNIRDKPIHMKLLLLIPSLGFYGISIILWAFEE